jgi:hypothetical protein
MSNWQVGGHTLSEKNAIKEYGLTLDDLADLEKRRRYMMGNGYYIYQRHDCLRIAQEKQVQRLQKEAPKTATPNSKKAEKPKPKPKPKKRGYVDSEDEDSFISSDEEYEAPKKPVRVAKRKKVVYSEDDDDEEDDYEAEYEAPKKPVRVAKRKKVDDSDEDDFPAKKRSKTVPKKTTKEKASSTVLDKKDVNKERNRLKKEWTAAIHPQMHQRKGGGSWHSAITLSRSLFHDLFFDLLSAEEKTTLLKDKNKAVTVRLLDYATAKATVGAGPCFKSCWGANGAVSLLPIVCQIQGTCLTMTAKFRAGYHYGDTYFTTK